MSDGHLKAISVLEFMFPEGRFEKPNGVPNFTRMEGFSKGTLPLNSTILLAGNENSAAERGQRREHYLVESSGITFFLRVCDAMPGSGYDEFVSIKQCAASATEEAHEIRKYALEWMSSQCSLHTNMIYIHSELSPAD